VRRIEMHFLADVFVTCRACNGRRYNRETLAVTYRGKSIADVLDLSVSDACDFFANYPAIRQKLETLRDVGLGYVTLGQSALTLSGGEAQRIKLARELAKKSTGKTLFILDEPTTGLHFGDIKLLLKVLDRLVDEGNTVVVIEHNLDVIKCADHVIDIGPEGGSRGGELIASGTPPQVARVAASATGKYLARSPDHFFFKKQVTSLRADFGVAPSATSARPEAPAPATPPVAAASSSSPIIVLLVSASPDTHARLRVDKEFRKIIDKIRGTRFRELFRFVQIQAARFEDLQTALQEHEPHILHISSHGNESGALRFEASDSGTSLVSKKRILRLLKALGDNFRAVIVNACHSSALVRDIPTEIGVPVIGMYTAVQDTTAIAFSSSFYESLGFGKSIEKAFGVALANIEDAESEEDDPDAENAEGPATDAAEESDVPELFPPADNDPKGLRKLILVKPN
jgi:ABC-type Na+ transport system ATPase subunit NatA